MGNVPESGLGPLNGLFFPFLVLCHLSVGRFQVWTNNVRPNELL
jgi:hypothetical protein